MPHTAPAAAQDEAVGPLVRGLAVLRALVGAGGQASPGELVRGTGLARSTVDRVLSTLARVGYLRLTGRDAELTPRLMELGNAYLAACRLPDTLGPLAERLGADLDESVSLAVPDGTGARFVYQSPRRRTMSLVFHIGDLLPADRGAPGALFAVHWGEADWRRWRERADDESGYAVPPAPEHTRFAERVAQARQAGVAVDDQVVEPGLLAVAVPVRDPAGRVVSALSAVSHTSRHDAASLVSTALPGLRQTVAAMEPALAAALAEPAAPAPAQPTGAAAASQPPEAEVAAATWLRASKQELGPEFVESLGRGLAVLTAFDEHRPALSLSAVAEATGLARATARRALLTLAQLGYVTQHGRLFRPTPRVLDLGFARLSTLTLAQIAQPHLAELVARVHDSASMAVLAGDDIRYVARVHTVRIMSVSITLGTRFPAYALSLIHIRDRAHGHRHRAVGGDPGRGGPRRLRPGRPGAGGRAAVDRRARARPRRPGGGRDQRVPARRPPVRRGVQGRPAAGAAPHRRARHRRPGRGQPIRPDQPGVSRGRDAGESRNGHRVAGGSAAPARTRAATDTDHAQEAVQRVPSAGSCRSIRYLVPASSTHLLPIRNAVCWVPS